MTNQDSTTTSTSGKIIQIDEGPVKGHLSAIVRGSVEETLNAVLQKEADELCQARRYERKAERVSTRAGTYERKLETKAGEVTLRMSKASSSRRATSESSDPRCARRDRAHEGAFSDLRFEDGPRFPGSLLGWALPRGWPSTLD